MVQAVAAAHGGTAELAGRSTFRITLPGG
ncbi:hypothetical protein [Actinomadura physcomitrii]